MKPLHNVVDFEKGINQPVLICKIPNIEQRSMVNPNHGPFRLSDGRTIDQRSATGPMNRPQTLDDIAGQNHILGPGSLLRRAIQADRLFSSIILYGPPGTGKTTLARVIANTTQAHFENLSAVFAGVAYLRKVIDAATERRRLYRKRTILFIDEVHRWNKPSRTRSCLMWRAVCLL